jgi:hypothetical protein
VSASRPSGLGCDLRPETAPNPSDHRAERIQRDGRDELEESRRPYCASLLCAGLVFDNGPVCASRGDAQFFVPFMSDGHFTGPDSRTESCGGGRRRHAL